MTIDRSADGGAAARSSLTAWPVPLYIPNLVGYLRIILSLCGLNFALQEQCDNALIVWIAAASLDLIDGIAARTLNQMSQFGILLDILADNMLRTAMWVSAAVECSKSDPSAGANVFSMYAVVIICLEWITMFCTQSNYTNKQQEGEKAHWKDVGKKVAVTESKRPPPPWVQAVFKNNFRSLPGIFAIYGLFVAPMGAYVRYANLSDKPTWPTRLLSNRHISMLVGTSYAGRVLSAMVELWLCYDFLRGVIARDECQKMKQKIR